MKKSGKDIEIQKLCSRIKELINKETQKNLMQELEKAKNDLKRALDEREKEKQEKDVYNEKLKREIDLLKENQSSFVSDAAQQLQEKINQLESKLIDKKASLNVKYNIMVNDNDKKITPATRWKKKYEELKNSYDKGSEEVKNLKEQVEVLKKIVENDFMELAKERISDLASIVNDESNTFSSEEQSEDKKEKEKL